MEVRSRMRFRDSGVDEKAQQVVVTNVDQVPKMEILEPQLFLGLLSSGFFAGLIPLFLGQQENLMFFFGLPPKIMGIGHICMGV